MILSKKSLLFVAFFLGLICIASRAQTGKDDKKEDRVIESIETSKTLEGKVKKLTIKSISGIATVDCKDLEAEELEIGLIEGATTVHLKLAKGKLKKLVLGTLDGVSKIDASMLEVDAIEIKDIKGAGVRKFTSGGNITIGTVNGTVKLELKAKGNITIASMAGAANANVLDCQDFAVAAPLEGVSSVAVNYRGTAKCEGNIASRIKLTKLETPK